MPITSAVLRRRKRFPGAGASSARQFATLRANNMADAWYFWLGSSGAALALVLWSGFATGTGARVLDLAAGVLLGVLLVMSALGGHISAFRWQLGSMGEEDTGYQIERLSTEWHCEHDIEHEYGNWDHVLVGPPGVFLLDSKLLHQTVVPDGDGVRAGRFQIRGRSTRGAARTLKSLLEDELGSPPGWVQGVVVIWGDFPARRYENDRVMYISGDGLVEWLSELPLKFNATQRAARRAAVVEVRNRLEAASTCDVVTSAPAL